MMVRLNIQALVFDVVDRSKEVLSVEQVWHAVRMRRTGTSRGAVCVALNRLYRAGKVLKKRKTRVDVKYGKKSDAK